jgi:glycosyltransferase involved in cell wall biosynthesis
MSDPLASIVIRCYNEREHIGKLLHGIFEQDMESFEVILVDSGSTDGTLEVAREYSVDDIVYISPEEFSFGRALNRGCEAASGKFCVFASAHVYPKRTNWLSQLLSRFDEDPDIAIVYGKQRGNSITKFPEKQVFKRWFPEEDIKYQDSPFCNNANAAIRREVWEDFPYDEELTGLEDLDWAKRVQEAGYEISYSADAEIVHVHDETPKQVYDRYRREAIAHNEIMTEQDFTFFDFLRAFSKNVVSDYRAAIREREIRGSVVEIPRFRFLQFWGTYRGFNEGNEVSERLWRRFYYPDTEGYPETDGEQSSPETIDYSEH